MSKRIPLSTLATALAVLAASPASARALTIHAIYDPSVSSAQQSVINSAISFYQTTFSDPITVNIGFGADPTCGLGCSLTFVDNVGYSSYHAALITDATSADDATALATLPGGTNNPVTGSTGLLVTTANGRAIGLGTPGNSLTCVSTMATMDGCVTFNPTFLTTTPPQVGLYSLMAVIEHEVDEVLGLGSDVGGTGFFASPRAEDLFRYSSPGTRTHAFTAACTGTAYFSIDGGNTNLDYFNNCNDGADTGDWAGIVGTPQVQDAFGTPGSSESLALGDPELRALDVVGYTLTSSVTPTPEPSTLLLFGTGFGGLLGLGIRRRRESQG